MVFLLAGGVLAENLAVTEDVESFVKGIVEEKGIVQGDIESVEKIDFDNLPEEINLENIDETNLAIYEVNYGEEKPVFILTVSDAKFKKTLKEIANKMILNFGYNEEFSDSLFLETATGVQTSSEKGYVMMRSGSITGLSTNLEVLEVKDSGEVEIIIYKNQEPVGFRNGFVVDTIGINKDYDIISKDTLTFEAGDVISVYAHVNGDVVAKDIITMMEINVLE